MADGLLAIPASVFAPAAVGADGVLRAGVAQSQRRAASVLHVSQARLLQPVGLDPAGRGSDRVHVFVRHARSAAGRRRARRGALACRRSRSCRGRRRGGDREGARRVRPVGRGARGGRVLHAVGLLGPAVGTVPAVLPRERDHRRAGRAHDPDAARQGGRRVDADQLGNVFPDARPRAEGVGEPVGDRRHRSHRDASFLRARRADPARDAGPRGAVG